MQRHNQTKETLSQGRVSYRSSVFFPDLVGPHKSAALETVTPRCAACEKVTLFCEDSERSVTTQYIIQPLFDRTRKDGYGTQVPMNARSCDMVSARPVSASTACTVDGEIDSSVAFCCSLMRLCTFTRAYCICSEDSARLLASDSGLIAITRKR
jgi:hypothetical protein